MCRYVFPYARIYRVACSRKAKGCIKSVFFKLFRPIETISNSGVNRVSAARGGSPGRPPFHVSSNGMCRIAKSLSRSNFSGKRFSWVSTPKYRPFSSKFSEQKSVFLVVNLKIPPLEQCRLGRSVPTAPPPIYATESRILPRHRPHR